MFMTDFKSPFLFPLPLLFFLGFHLAGRRRFCVQFYSSPSSLKEDVEFEKKYVPVFLTSTSIRLLIHEEGRDKHFLVHKDEEVWNLIVFPGPFLQPLSLCLLLSLSPLTVSHSGPGVKQKFVKTRLYFFLSLSPLSIPRSPSRPMPFLVHLTEEGGEWLLNG
jgi:hypothetical protein